MSDSEDGSDSQHSEPSRAEGAGARVVELRPGKHSARAIGKAERAKQARGKTLCGRGFHRWQVASERPFDVKLGKLVTLERCERCGKERTFSR
ncbi:MAG: hypothetical protein NXH85_18860 [Pseudomonadaceae bacterium]|nr:hypothetical protein [Pseudomonadaceae bacterium]